MTEHYIPQERDLPAGRLTKLKEDLMTQIEHDVDAESRAATVVTHRRWRRLGLTAAAFLAGLGLTAAFVVGGDDSASANTAVRNADGEIVITLREAKHPKDLQRRLEDLGVPVVVDFLESGYGCDPARSTGWVQEQAGAELFGGPDDHADDPPRYVLHPDRIPAGLTAVLEFQIDEHEGAIAAQVTYRFTTSSVGPCEPVRNGSIVDAEEGIAGG